MRHLRENTIRVSALGLAVCAVLVACGREPTGSGEQQSGVGRIQAISWVAEFPPGYREYRAQASEAPGGAGSLVEFSKVRVRMLNADGSVALDTMVAFPPGYEEVQMTFPVTLPVSAPASGAPLALNLRYVNAAGDTVFSGGPVTITAVPSPPGSPAPPAQTVTIPLNYSGPGATTATRVLITPRTLTVNTGESFSVSAVALDNAGEVVKGVPILFSTGNGAVASVNAATGAGTAAQTRGTTSILAQLLTGPADALALTVLSPPKSIALVSGDSQRAPVSSTLARQATVKVSATDGGPAAGVVVNFTASGDGTAITALDTTDAAGIASTSWKLGTIAGPQTLSASTGALAGSLVTFTATARSITPVRLSISGTLPDSLAAGAPLPQALEIRALTADGDTATAFEGPVTLSLGEGAGGALLGPVTANAARGIATFSGVSFRTPGTFTLTASAGSLAAATTNSVRVVPGPARALAFQAYPVLGGSASAGLDVISVQVRDSLGNAATSFTGGITISAEGGPADAALSGTTSVNAVAGVATFGGVSLRRAGAYSLRAVGNNLAPTTGPAFTIVPGPPANIALVSGGGQSGPGASVLAKPIVVKVTDAWTNIISGATISFTAATGSATPSTAKSDGDGLAQTLWTLGPSAGGQTLNVSATGLSPSALVVPASATTAASGPATQLAFSVAPNDAEAGAVFNPGVTVTAKDAAGNVAVDFTGAVTVTLNTGTAGLLADVAETPVGPTLSGTRTVNAVAGVARFTDLSMTKAAASYSLTASSGALSATSNSFRVRAAKPKHIRASDGNGQSNTVGKRLGKKFVVTITDEFENPTPGAAVTWTNVSGTGALEEQTLSTDSSGRAQAGLLLGNGAGKHRVSAGVDGTAEGPLVFEAIGVADKAKKLVATGGPANGSKHKAGATFPQLRVEARDQFDNVDSSFAGPVALGFAANAGDTAVAGNKSANAVGGIATFSNASLRKAGRGYRLRITGTDVSPDSTGVFDVEAGPPKKLRAEDGHGQSSSVNKKLGKKLLLASTDDYDNPTPGVAVSWSSVLGNGEISEQSAQTDSTGRASAALKLNTKAGKHRVSATLTGAEDTPVLFDADAIADKAKKLVASGGPANGSKHKAGANFPSLKVEAQDEFGNVDSSFTGTVSLGLALNPGDSAVAGNKSANAVGGIANFANASLRKAATGYRLRVSGADLSPDSSGLFDIEAGAPKKLRAEDGHGQSSTVNKKLGKKLLLSSTDEYDNPTPGVTVSWSSVLGNGELSEQSATTDATGHASAALTLNTKAGKHRVSATLAGAEETPVIFDADAVADKAKKLAVSGGPSGGSKHKAGANFPALKVEAQDEFGNVDSTFAGFVSLGLATNPGADSAIAGNKGANAAGGVVTFTNANLRKTGAGYRIRASAESLDSDSTGTFTVESGPVKHLAADSGAAQSNTVGRGLSKKLVIRATDEYGNAATGETVIWTNALGGGSLGDQSFTTDENGRARASLTLGTGAGKHKIRASVAGLEGNIEFESDAVADNAKKLRVASGPGSGSNKTAGTSISVKVEAIDQYGNVDSSYTGAVSLGFATNPGADTAVAGGKVLNATKGVVEFTTSNVRKAGSGYRLRASSAALETDSTAAFNVTAAEANVVTVVSGNSQKGQKGKSLNKPFEVSVTDDFGNSTGGIDVEWTVTDETDDIISSTTVTTDASGKATVTLTLGQQSGKRHVRAAIKNKPTAIAAEFEAEDEVSPPPLI